MKKRVLRAKQLRDDGVTWQKIPEILNKEGYRNAKGKPINMSAIHQEVMKAFPKARKYKNRGLITW